MSSQQFQFFNSLSLVIIGGRGLPYLTSLSETWYVRCQAFNVFDHIFKVFKVHI